MSGAYERSTWNHQVGTHQRENYKLTIRQTISINSFHILCASRCVENIRNRDRYLGVVAGGGSIVRRSHFVVGPVANYCQGSVRNTTEY